MHEISQRFFLGTRRTDLAIVRIWFMRLRTRRRLRDLDAAALDDVGISEPERQRECAKWFREP